MEMKNTLLSLLLLTGSTLTSYAQKTDWSKKNWSKPEATEFWDVKPPIVTPAQKPGDAPSDAMVLFNGTTMNQWVMSKDGSPANWNLKDGAMTVKLNTGDIQTKEQFGSCQLHVEFKIPADSKNSADPHNAGNSGVFLQERYEVQIFDSYQDEVPLYSNGQCGSLYKQAIPLANACSRPGEWNTYDIFYTEPSFHPNGAVNVPAYITVVHNGILVLNHFQIQGPIAYIGVPKYEPHSKASLKLQGHGSEVSFRNIWIRPL